MKNKINILLVTPIPPWPLNTGGQQRTNHLFNALSEIGQVDTFFCGVHRKDTLEVIKTAKNRFNLAGIVSWHLLRDRLPLPLRFFSQEIKSRLRPFLNYNFSRYSPYNPAVKLFNEITKRKKYHLIVSRYVMPACKTNAIKYHPIIIDIDDIDSNIYKTFSMTPSISKYERKMLLLKANNINKTLQERTKDCDYLWVSSENDRHFFPNNLVDVLPNIPQKKQNLIKRDELQLQRSTNSILIVGLMEYPPNRDGVYIFLKKIWPTIIQAIPDAVFTIAGKLLKEDYENWNKVKGVKVLGYSKHLDELYEDCSFTVVPVYYGGGTKIKVIESYLYARPCVVTKHAHYGYETVLKQKDTIFVADSYKEMAKYCIKLLKDPTLSKKMGEKGQSIINKAYNYEIFKEKVFSTVEKIL